MAEIPPIPFRCVDTLGDLATGEMVPVGLVAMNPRHAGRHYVPGELYHLVPYEDRSWLSHKHEFAFIKSAWDSLPEEYNDQPWATSPEHLRKYALIKTKWCNSQTYACGTKAEAQRWAQNLRPLDEYSIVTTEGSTVYRFTAMSQSRRAMGAKAFQKSKSDILDFLADLVGVGPEALKGAESA